MFENPVWIIVGGGFLVAGGAYFWIQSGKKYALYITAAIAVITVLLLLINIQVETPREKIKSTLNELAAALKNNQFETIFGHIHPNAQPSVISAKTEVQKYEFSDARITRIKDISVNTDSNPPTAVAQFNATVHAQFQTFNGRVPRFVKLYFMKRDGRWLITDFEHFDATKGFREDL